jgi:hypothetical protein
MTDLSIHTWYRLIEKREVDHIRVGKKILLSDQQLLSFIENHTVEAEDWPERTRRSK